MLPSPQWSTSPAPTTSSRPAPVYPGLPGAAFEFSYLRTVPAPPKTSESVSVIQPSSSSGTSQFHNGANGSRGQGNRGGFSRGNYHHRPGQSSGQFFRSADTPQKKKYLCDPCGKAFAEEQKLQEHVAEHVVCGREGCKFTAHPKVVALHIQLQHDTGLYRRMLINDNPEEVQKWRDERRRKFPTRENIERKKIEAATRHSRGERIDVPRRRFNNRGGGWNNRPQVPLPPQVPEPKIPSPAKEVPPSVALPSALATLACSYASGSDSDNEAPTEEPIGRQLEDPLLLPPPDKKPKMEAPSKPQEQKKFGLTVRQKYTGRRRPPTLLQKLLAGEIRHERNVLLQCIRYVVENNYLQN